MTLVKFNKKREYKIICACHYVMFLPVEKDKIRLLAKCYTCMNSVMHINTSSYDLCMQTTPMYLRMCV